MTHIFRPMPSFIAILIGSFSMLNAEPSCNQVRQQWNAVAHIQYATYDRDVFSNLLQLFKDAQKCKEEVVALLQKAQESNNEITAKMYQSDYDEMTNIIRAITYKINVLCAKLVDYDYCSLVNSNSPREVRRPVRVVRQVIYVPCVLVPSSE